MGALSFGGGFVIIPLMQSDAVSRYHWMTGPQFLDAVALGQVTPGPVVGTVAAVGYAAGGFGAALLAAAVAFAPSFAFVLAGRSRFDRLRGNPAARAFLDGAGPAAIGAIAGSSVLLAGELREWWQYVVLRPPRRRCSSPAAVSSACCWPQPWLERWRSSPARASRGRWRASQHLAHNGIIGRGLDPRG